MTRIAINGFGRIGRGIVRAAVAQGSDLEIVAVNDLTDAETLAHLLTYDSAYGKLEAPVSADGNVLRVGDREIRVLSERDPAGLPWGDLGIDVVVEVTGRFTAREDAAAHLTAGARRVLVGAPSSGADATLVLGVNDDTFDPEQHFVVSGASCTTNALAPLAQVLDQAFGIEHGFVTTVHAYTQDQNLLDAAHRDLRRARTAAVNLIPTTTGAAKAIGHVLPNLDGKLSGDALRVPIPVGSYVEMSAAVERPGSLEELLAEYRRASEGRLQGILNYSEAPLVSSDIVGNPASTVFDAPLTRVEGRFVKVAAWYDNEWSFANRMVETMERVLG